MPNWCDNYLIIAGPTEDLAAFAARARGTRPQYRETQSDRKAARDPETEVSPLSFDALVPVPERLLERTYGGEEEQRLGDKKRDWLDPDHNGHDWEVVNWGCKWGADGVVVTWLGDTELVYTFCTPWGPPLPFTEKVSDLFPTLTFTLEFREPGMAFKGWATAHSGAIEEQVVVGNYDRTWAAEPDRVLEELGPGREVVVYERTELLPDLRIGDPPERLSIWTGGNGCHYVFATRGRSEAKIRTLTDREELREFCSEMTAEPEEFFPSSGYQPVAPLAPDPTPIFTDVDYV